MKKKSSRRPAKASTVIPREIISTCQITTSAGTPVTWTGYRRVGAPKGARPDFYVSTLPDNTDDTSPSEYNLFAIAAQAKSFPITLTVLDRDVVYFISAPGGKPQRMTVTRGTPFSVPPRGTGGEITKVTLTFDGDYCSVQAVAEFGSETFLAENAEDAETTELTDDETGPPPPLPNNEE